MIEHLTAVGYEQTKAKLSNMQRRLDALERRDDLTPEHKAAARRSFRQMMAQYGLEMELFEVDQSLSTKSDPSVP